MLYKFVLQIRHSPHSATHRHLATQGSRLITKGRHGEHGLHPHVLHAQQVPVRHCIPSDNAREERRHSDVVVDAVTDRARLMDAVALRHQYFTHDAELLVYANKQDQSGCVEIESVLEILNLDGVTKSQQHHMQAAAVVESEGIYEGLDWLCKALYICSRLIVNLSSGCRERLRSPHCDIVAIKQPSSHNTTAI